MDRHRPRHRRRRERARRGHERRVIRHRARDARRPRSRRSAGTRRRPTWDDVFAAAEDENAWTDLGHPEWGTFKLGKTSPLIASSGEAALLASYGSAAGSVADLTADQIEDADVTDEVRQHELATSHYMATPEHFLWHARQSEDAGSVADFLSAVIVDEKSVWDYNRGITSRDGVTRVQSDPPEEQLVPIYPSDGFYVADNPAVVLTGTWVDDAEKPPPARLPPLHRRRSRASRSCASPGTATSTASSTRSSPRSAS